MNEYEATSELVLEAWLCRELGLTPNCSAMLRLWPEQRQAMFDIFTVFIPTEKVREAKLVNKEVSDLEDKSATEFLDDSMKKAMRTQLARQGMTSDKIDNYLQKMANQQKELTINEKKKKLGLVPDDEDNFENTVEKFKRLGQELEKKKQSSF